MAPWGVINKFLLAEKNTSSLHYLKIFFFGKKMEGYSFCIHYPPENKAP
jgi:hypothetical protein